MKSIRVKPQQGDQRAEKLHSTCVCVGGGSHSLPNSSRGKKVSQDAERERERKKDPTSCFQLPAMWSAQRLILRLAWKCDFKAWGRGVRVGGVRRKVEREGQANRGWQQATNPLPSHVSMQTEVNPHRQQRLSLPGPYTSCSASRSPLSPECRCSPQHHFRYPFF